MNSVPNNLQQTGLGSERLDRVRHWLDVQVDSHRLAGASVLVARNGCVAMAAASGHADIELASPFTTETIVRLYSMTKPVTTVAAMMLYERGCFQLDDPLALYIPEFADTPVWLGDSVKSDDLLGSVTSQNSHITIRQLMNHTSGFTYGFMHQTPVDRYYRDNNIDFNAADNNESLESMVSRLADMPLLAQPGSSWNYGVSTDVLGRLVEIWSGMSLSQFFNTEIFQPLGMGETGFHAAAEHHERCAKLYGPADGTSLSSVGNVRDPLQGPREPVGVVRLDEGMENRIIEPPLLCSGGGGLVGTLSDYHRFSQMLLNRGSYEGVQLLGRKTVEYMMTNHLPEGRDMAAMGQASWSETSYEGIGFGLGFAVVLDPVKAHIVTSPGECHWGGAASTFFWVDPAEDLLVVFLTQLLPSSTYPLRRELRTLVYQSIIR